LAKRNNKEEHIRVRKTRRLLLSSKAAALGLEQVKEMETSVNYFKACENLTNKFTGKKDKETAPATMGTTMENPPPESYTRENPVTVNCHLLHIHRTGYAQSDAAVDMS
jgi:hypothetical protein